MFSSCCYAGSTPMNIKLCQNCPDFLVTCIPVVGRDGYSNGDCDCFLCEFCSMDCVYALSTNL